jgi:hypothetical protein
VADTTQLLTEIRDALRELVALSKQRLSRTTNGTGGGAVASDSDLDGKYGDPEVKAKDPRDWNGPQMKGRKFSQCPPEYLDLIADRFDYFAARDDKENARDDKGNPKSKYARRDAARARGWAARMRAGTHKAPPVEESAGWTVAGDDEVQY